VATGKGEPAASVPGAPRKSQVQSTRYAETVCEIALDVAVAYGAYCLFGWIGLILWVIFLIGWFSTQLIGNQQIILETLLSGLPDRCVFAIERSWTRAGSSMSRASTTMLA